MPEIVEYPLSSLDQGRAGAFISMGWQWWTRTRGAFARGGDLLEHLLPALQLDVISERDDKPRLLYVGPRSTSAQVFGTDWARHATGQPGVPDAQFTRGVNPVYLEVGRTKEPAYHEISATLRRPDGRALRVEYRRLLVACRIRTGAPVIGCLTEFIGPAGGRGILGRVAASTLATRLN